MHQKAGVRGERRGLVEHIEVADSELLLNGVSNLDGSSSLTILSVGTANADRSGTSLGLNSERNMVGSGRDGQSLVEGIKLLADFGEFSRVDRDNRAVLGLGDVEVLGIERDEVHGELSHALGLSVLESELKMSWVILSRKSDAVSGISQLHDLGQESDVDSKDHSGIGTVVLESLHAEVQRDKGDVGAIHSLKGNAYKNENIQLDFDSIELS